MSSQHVTPNGHKVQQQVSSSSKDGRSVATNALERSATFWQVLLLLIAGLVLLITQQAIASTPSTPISYGVRLMPSSSNLANDTAGLTYDDDDGGKQYNDDDEGEENLNGNDNNQATTATAVSPSNSDSAVAAAINKRKYHAASWNASDEDYTWVGATWIPPPGVKHYSVQDMLDLYSKVNILFVGDSTLRRPFQTLFLMLNSTSDLLTVDYLENSDRLGLGLSSVEELCSNTTLRHGIRWYRDNPNKLRQQQVVCHDTPVLSEADNSISNSSTNNDDTNLPQQQAPRTKGWLDYASIRCYKDVIHIVDKDGKERKVTKDYDFLVIGAGIWETIDQYKCGERKATPPDHFLSMVKALDTAYSNTDLQVLVRTTGYDARDHFFNTTHALNVKARNYLRDRNVAETNKTYSFAVDVVDWAAPMQERSFGTNNRLEGDIMPHFGLQARLLFLQMMTYRVDRTLQEREELAERKKIEG